MSKAYFMLSLHLDKRQTVTPRLIQSQCLSPWFLSLSRLVLPSEWGLLYSRTQKIRVSPKPLAPTLQFSNHLFRNVIYLHFTQPYTTAGLIFLLIFTTGERGAHTTFGPHNGVLDSCSLFPSHQTLFDEWFMSRNLWKGLPHANVN